MYSFFLNYIFLFVLIYDLPAQYYPLSGARAAGIANAAVTISDEWALFHNIAGIASQNKVLTGVWYKNEYALKACRATSVHLTSPLLKGGFGAFVSKYGNEIYSITTISAGYAHKINFVSLGIKVNYVQVVIQDLGVGKNIVVDFGGIAELISSKLFFGATINNINQASIKHEVLPVLMNAGLSYRPNKKVLLSIEVQKDLLYKHTLKTGLEYSFLQNFSCRTGVTTNPFVNFFGLGFNNKIFKLDYALSKHSQLGYSHCISIIVIFNKQK